MQLSKGGFACAVAAEQREQRAAFDVQVHAVEHGAAAVGVVQVFDVQHVVFLTKRGIRHTFNHLMIDELQVTGKISGSLRRLYLVHLCASCRRGHSFRCVKTSPLAELLF